MLSSSGSAVVQMFFYNSTCICPRMVAYSAYHCHTKLSNVENTSVHLICTFLPFLFNVISVCWCVFAASNVCNISRQHLPASRASSWHPFYAVCAVSMLRRRLCALQCGRCFQRNHREPREEGTTTGEFRCLMWFRHPKKIQRIAYHPNLIDLRFIQLLRKFSLKKFTNQLERIHKPQTKNR